MTGGSAVSVGSDLAGESVRDRFDKMYHDIRLRICMLDFPPGTKLSEEALAGEFGVSRTPLRRVLARLEREGLVQSVHGVGTLVTDVEIEELAQVYALRLELCELVGRLDPLPPSPALLAEFESLAARARALEDAPEARAFAKLNVDFLEAHVLLTANEPLREVSRLLYYQTARIWLKSVFASRIDLDEEVRIFRHEVEDFMRAMRLGDLSAAAHIHRGHISMSFARMRRNAAGDRIA